MAPARVPGEDAVAGTVVTGRGLTSLAGAVAQVCPTVRGHVVVLAGLSQPTPVSAEVLHELVDVLLERGATRVSVGSQLRAVDRDRGHTDVVELAALAGLGTRTPRGRPHAVVDLAEDADTSLAPERSVLHGRAVSAAWAAADTRVLLAPAATDLLDGYAAGLDCLLRAAEEVAGAAPGDVVADLLDLVPPELVVVDALAVSAGPDGRRLPRWVAADTLVVGPDVLAVDAAVASLLAQDRSSSRLFAAALAGRSARRSAHLSAHGPSLRSTPGADGPRVPGRVAGVMADALPGAVGPHPAARTAAVRLAVDPSLERVLSAAVGGPDPGAAAVDPVLAVLRAVLTPLVEGAADGAGAVALAGVLDTVSTAAQGVRAWQVGLDKSSVNRRVVPLGFDPDAVDGSTYDAVPSFFEEFDDVLDGLGAAGARRRPDDGPDPGPGAGGEGLRWCLVDGATVFETEREVAADFDAFVARVDVAAGISLMADYLGGRRVTVPGGSPGTTRQAERNLYLPQPNYLAAWGGEPIDVCKIELVERSTDHHRLTWRTLDSPNGSATFDDGSLTFSRSAAGTRVRVRGRQLFSLPSSWGGLDLSGVPELRGPLLEEAYRRFFTTTFDNLEACFEGRAFRIGRPPPSPHDPLLTRSLEVLLGAARSWLDDRGPAPRSGAGAGTAGASGVDLHGFRHVRGRR